MDRFEMIEKIYKEIWWHDEWTALVDKDVIRIWDVLSWLNGIDLSNEVIDHESSFMFMTARLLKERRQPNGYSLSGTIDEQNTECIKFVYDLVIKSLNE